MSRPSSSKSTPGTEPSAVEVTPLQAPEGAVTRAEALTRERHFLERFERNFARLEKLHCPVDGKSYSTNGAAATADDPYRNVVEVLKARGLYDPSLLDCLPHDRSVRFEMPTGGLFRRKKPRLIVTAIASSPVGDLAQIGASLEAMTRESLQALIRDQVRESDAYHVLGVLATTGWAPEVFERIPRGQNYGVVLVERTSSGGWRLADSLPKELGNVVSVFDPEEFDEKVARAFYWIEQQAELKIPGGHLDLERVTTALEITRDVLDVALKQVSQEDEALKVTEVGGREILKRDRY